MKSSPLKMVELRDLSERDREELLERSELDVDEVLPRVREIVSEVREGGDSALLDFTEKFDEVELTSDQLRVSEEEISRAYEVLDKEDVGAIEGAADSVRRYHRHQMPEEWMEEFEPGIYAGQIIRSLVRVGAYVPGGAAQYPSTVLMSVIPAKVAGVDEVIVCTPPNPEKKVNPATLVAADISEADEVYKLGGAQAVAGMAYGTETIPQVEKIVGPGNVYVSAAKREVSSEVDIDFMAGPTEVLIIADSGADPHFIALDLVAQAEHDPLSSSILVTTSEEVAGSVKDEIKSLLEEIPRREIAAKSLEGYGHIILAGDLEEGMKFANDYAPEHLQIMVRDPEGILDQVENAGAIFLGPYSPTSVGDFAVGPSHILPTGGDARLYDGLSVLDFLRLPTVQRLSKEGLERISEVVESFAEMEGLPGHFRCVKERLEGD